MIASLIYSMDRVANTVGHYDAYRKIKNSFYGRDEIAAWTDDVEVVDSDEGIIIFPHEAYEVIIKPDGIYCIGTKLQKVE